MLHFKKYFCYKKKSCFENVTWVKVLYVSIIMKMYLVLKVTYLIQKNVHSILKRNATNDYFQNSEISEKCSHLRWRLNRLNRHVDVCFWMEFVGYIDTPGTSPTHAEGYLLREITTLCQTWVYDTWDEIRLIRQTPSNWIVACNWQLQSATAFTSFCSVITAVKSVWC